LVVGTKYVGLDGGGLYLLSKDNQWQTFPNFPSTANENALADGKLSYMINTVRATAENELWVGTEVGLGRYNAAADEWTRFTTDDGLPSNNIWALFVDNAGGIWVGTDLGAARFDGESFEVAPQGPPYGVTGITQDPEGRLYFAGGGGIWRFTAANNEWEEFSTATQTLTTFNLFGALAAEDVLFFGSDGGGTVVYANDQFQYAFIENLPVNYATGHILRAPDDELWFVEESGTYPDRYNLNEGRWPGYVEPPCGCEPLAFDAQGNLWAVEWPHFLHVVAPNGADARYGPEHGLPENSYIWAVAFAPDGSTWLGTETGVVHFNGESFDQIIRAADAGFATDSIRDVFVSFDGALWAASQTTETTSGSVSRFKDGAWMHFTSENAFTGNFGIGTDFMEDASGQLWLSTVGDGVYRWVDEAWKKVEGELPSEYVSALTLGPDGSVWVATDTGAARLNGDAWEAFEQGDDELISRFVYDIYVEPNGAVWFATSSGVSRWGP
jgi:ligand-binding sensor domain-containing protein